MENKSIIDIADEMGLPIPENRKEREFVRLIAQCRTEKPVPINTWSTEKSKNKRIRKWGKGDSLASSFNAMKIRSEPAEFSTKLMNVKGPIRVLASNLLVEGKQGPSLAKLMSVKGPMRVRKSTLPANYKESPRRIRGELQKEKKTMRMKDPDPKLTRRTGGSFYTWETVTEEKQPLEKQIHEIIVDFNGRKCVEAPRHKEEIFKKRYIRPIQPFTWMSVNTVNGCMLGVFARIEIPKDAYVCEYSGELSTKDSVSAWMKTLEQKEAFDIEGYMIEEDSGRGDRTVIVAHNPMHKGTVTLGRLIKTTSCKKHQNVKHDWVDDGTGRKSLLLKASKKIMKGAQLLMDSGWKSGFGRDLSCPVCNNYSISDQINPEDISLDDLPMIEIVTNETTDEKEVLFRMMERLSDRLGGKQYGLTVNPIDFNEMWLSLMGKVFPNDMNNVPFVSENDKFLNKLLDFFASLMEVTSKHLNMRCASVIFFFINKGKVIPAIHNFGRNIHKKLHECVDTVIAGYIIDQGTESVSIMTSRDLISQEDILTNLMRRTSKPHQFILTPLKQLREQGIKISTVKKLCDVLSGKRDPF